MPNPIAVVAHDRSDAVVARLAEVFALNLTDPEPAMLLDVGTGEQPVWDDVRLLVVGSPVVDGDASPAVLSWLASIEAPGRRLAVAAFDVRHRGGWLRRGNAAGRVSKALRRKGFLPDMGTETFYLGDEPGHPAGEPGQRAEGRLEEGQLERAATWSFGLGIAAGTRPAT